MSGFPGYDPLRDRRNVRRQKRTEWSIVAMVLVVLAVGVPLAVMAYQDCREEGLTALYCLMSLG